MERYTVITVDMDTAGIGSAAGGLEKTLQQLQQTTEQAFSAKTVVQYVKTTTGALTKLRNTLSGVKRSLADFDQLQRLDKPEAAKTTTSQKKTSTISYKNGTQMLLEYLASTDVRQQLAMLKLVQFSVEQCNDAIRSSLGIRDQLCGAHNRETILLNTNTTAWYLNEAARMSALTAQLAQTVAAGQWVVVCEAASLATLNFAMALAAVEAAMASVAKGLAVICLGAQNVGVAWKTLGFSGQQLCSQLSISAQQLGQSFQTLYSRDMILATQRGMSTTGILMRTGLEQLLSILEGSFVPRWHEAWQQIAQDYLTIMGSMPSQLRIVVNRMISLFNNMLTVITGSMNALISAMNQLRMNAGSAGLTVGKLPPVSVPRIPYLAKGAVLPANRPFLAMVGDQRHGTNIEAPLTTIQEAMSLVMDDHTAAIMAGFEASVGVQKEILEAVLGIHIGDDVIGRASQRYARKMAVVRGGSI